jgi:hypothetical protein
MPCALLSSSARISSGTSYGPARAGWSAADRGPATGSAALSPGGRRRRPRDNASRAASRRSATEPTRCWRRPSGWPIFCASMSPSIGRRPHALADLRLARKPAGEADLDVAILIGRDPVAALHLALAHHRPGPHRRVHLVAGAVEEAGVDEDDAVLHRLGCRRRDWRRCGAPRPSRRPSACGAPGRADPRPRRTGDW